MSLFKTLNKGIAYENKINNLLKEHKIQDENFHGAGSDSNAPDAEIIIANGKYKVEVKLNLKVDFGQGSLDYDANVGKWTLGGSDTESAEQMRKFLTQIKVPELVNEAWGSFGQPKKFTVPLGLYQKSDVDHDYENFKNHFTDVPYNSVADYYNSKNTYYIQIGKFGFYFMGQDIGNIGVPEFKPELRLRVRIKRGRSKPIYNYRFTTALQAKSLEQSTFDLEKPETLELLQILTI